VNKIAFEVKDSI